ncbi:hypothetical protein BdWA1_001062 [Babesia duncani]|uniref:Uncharacterized protein n=1 Tax=Babesia duncani TaxID=323732 RepID=A0AAD9UQN6_9APIC|nr:hypothetical protein BdWA1_001062 [Babesia duncani]
MLNVWQLQESINASILALVNSENKSQEYTALDDLYVHISQYRENRQEIRKLAIGIDQSFEENLNRLCKFMVSHILKSKYVCINHDALVKLQSLLIDICYKDSTIKTNVDAELKAVIHIWRVAYCKSGTFETCGSSVASISVDYAVLISDLIPIAGEQSIPLIFILLEILKYAENKRIVSNVLNILSCIPSGIDITKVYPGIISRIVSKLSHLNENQFSIAIKTLSVLLVGSIKCDEFIPKTLQWVEHVLHKYAKPYRNHLLPLIKTCISINIICKRLQDPISQFILKYETVELAPFIRSSFCELKVALRSLVTRSLKEPNEESLRIYNGYLKLLEVIPAIEVDFYLALGFLLQFDFYQGCFETRATYNRKYDVDVDIKLPNANTSGVKIGTRIWIIKEKQCANKNTTVGNCVIQSIKSESKSCSLIIPSIANIHSSAVTPKQPLIEVVCASDNNVEGSNSTLQESPDTRGTLVDFDSMLKGCAINTKVMDFEKVQEDKVLSLFENVAGHHFKSLGKNLQLDTLYNITNSLVFNRVDIETAMLACRLLHLFSIFTRVISIEEFKHVGIAFLQSMVNDSFFNFVLAHDPCEPIIVLLKARFTCALSQLLYKACREQIDILPREQFGSLLFWLLPECMSDSPMVSFNSIRLFKVLNLTHLQFSLVQEPMLRVYFNSMVNKSIQSLAVDDVGVYAIRVCDVVYCISRTDFADSKSIFDLCLAISDYAFKLNDPATHQMGIGDVSTMLYTFNHLLVALYKCPKCIMESKFEGQVIDFNLAIATLVATRVRYYVNGAKIGHLSLVALYRCFKIFSQNVKVFHVRLGEMWDVIEFALEGNKSNYGNLIVLMAIIQLMLEHGFVLMQHRMRESMPIMIDILNKVDISSAHKYNQSQKYRAVVSVLHVVAKVASMVENRDLFSLCLHAALVACENRTLVKPKCTRAP